MVELDGIVLCGKRTRKAKHLVTVEDLRNLVFDSPNKCIVKQEIQHYKIKNKKVTSDYVIYFFNSNSMWSFSTIDENVPIMTIGQSKEYVEDRFGGMWLWEYANIKQDKWISLYEYFNKRYNELCTLENRIDKKDRELFNKIKLNVIQTLSWFSMSICKGDIKEIDRCVVLANLCLEDINSMFKELNKERV